MIATKAMPAAFGRIENWIDYQFLNKVIKE